MMPMDLRRMIPAPHVVKVALRFQCQGLEGFNIIHVLCGGPASPSDLTAIAAVFQDWWNNDYRPAISNQCTFQGADLTALDSAGSPILAYLNTGPSTGLDANQPYAPQVSLAISLRTGLSGRSYRGRWYMVGLTMGFPSSGGLISTASQGYIQGQCNLLRTKLVTAGYQLAVVSYYHGVTAGGDKIPRPVAVSTPVNSIVVGTRLDSQRRRLPKEGRV